MATTGEGKDVSPPSGHLIPSRSASVKPEVEMATTGEGKDVSARAVPRVVREQVRLAPPNKLRQFKALMRKHYSSYKRNKELLSGEIFTTVLYAVLLCIFGLTASSRVDPARTYSEDQVQIVSPIRAAFDAPFASAAATTTTQQRRCC